MKSLFFLPVFICLFLANFSGCGGSSSGATADTETALKGLSSCSAVSGEAVICGTALAADGVTPIVGATVTQNTASSSESLPLKGLYVANNPLKLAANDSACTTDDAGAFACAGMTTAGTSTFTITGSGYTVSFSATTTLGETTTVATSDTTASSSESTIKWLAVADYYDGVQLLLSQLKGCTLTGDESSPADLRTSTECETANLYVVAGEDVDTTFSSVDNLTTYDSIFINCAADMSSYSDVLVAYVAQGGNLYFSDLAEDGLTAAFPGNITYGNNLVTTSGNVTGSVNHSGLATYLGASTMDIAFDLSIWQPITSVASNVTTYISGDTSSLNGTVDAPITVGWKEGTGGCIYYTSYHIEGASTGSDQEKALKYLILNIDSVCE